MKVAIVNKHPADGPGGSEIQCALLADGLVSRGHEVTYIAPHRVHRPAPAQLPDVAYRFVRVPQWGRAIARTVQSCGVDVVYWRFNKRGLRIAVRDLARAGIPVVFAVSHVNDLIPWSRKPVAGSRLRRLVAAPLLAAMNRWQHAGLRRVAAMTTNNPDLLAKLPAPVAQHVPNGMIDDRGQFSWPRPYCLWVSGLKASKRPRAAVRLAGEIADLGVDVLMVGGVQERGYEDLVNGRGTPDNLHYLGERSLRDVNAMFAGARLHVHTCMPEGFPNVLIQAWMQGCASVSLGFDPGGVIAERMLGVHAEDDWDRFVAGVRSYLTDERLRVDTGTRARAYARTEFGVDTMVEHVEALLADMH